MNISSSILYILVQKLPNNEEIVRSTLDGTMFIILLNIGLVTPLCEEIIFRLNFKNLFKNKFIFSIVTGLIFALMHLVVSSSLIELIFIIPYFIMGFTLGYIYSDSNNLMNSILVHMINNVGTVLLLMVAS